MYCLGAFPWISQGLISWSCDVTSYQRVHSLSSNFSGSL